MYGLDKVGAPDATTAKAMLNEIGGSWWAVYFGGPRRNRASIESWTPERIQTYRDKGITIFLPIYVGRQVLINGRPADRQIDDTRHLTAAQGKADGADAVNDAGPYGFGPGSPLCLDLENETFERAREGSVAYVLAWCQEVRARGFRPGVYTNKGALVRLHGQPHAPDWMWLAKWIDHVHIPGLDPHVIDNFGDHLWPDVGQRVWQYAGALRNPTRPCRVRGLDVDINIADPTCLVGGGAGPALEELTVRKEDDMVILISAPQQAVRALVGSKVIGFKGGDDLESFRAACAEADVTVVEWRCTVDQYDDTTKLYNG